MTQPSDNPAPPPSSVPTTKPSESRKAADNETTSSGKRYVVATPWHVDELHGGDSFPTITPHGVEMSEQEADAAVAAGNSLFLRLSVEEAS